MNYDVDQMHAIQFKGLEALEKGVIGEAIGRIVVKRFLQENIGAVIPELQGKDHWIVEKAVTPFENANFRTNPYLLEMPLKSFFPKIDGWLPDTEFVISEKKPTWLYVSEREDEDEDQQYVRDFDDWQASGESPN